MLMPLSMLNRKEVGNVTDTVNGTSKLQYSVVAWQQTTTWSMKVAYTRYLGQMISKKRQLRHRTRPQKSYEIY